ncbi:MAG: 16S rRNA (guanine(966)-N(2))-methyltransferase RsmD [Chlamydiia bacterium]|nr:16S rRNA (guanine(966)-N(2))-methyltransferase RsmD [Chlamydiia bacterium]MCB1115332.1 16S rRNA (guanine(966)-N(2))-methyltransferase RsmD [Chlamydiia bacterium]
MRIIGGFLKNRAIKTPKGSQTRPTSERLRETVFNIAQHAVEGKTFLDLFAGSGAMGFEALSRGAVSATFIEKDRLALKALDDNIAALGLKNQAKVISGDVLAVIKRLNGLSFDLIYVDPPYEKGLQIMALELIERYQLLAPDGLLFVEESEKTVLDFSSLSLLALRKKRKVGSTFLYELMSTA